MVLKIGPATATADYQFTDITPYIAENGVEWQRNDLDGPNAGRTLSGLLIRDRVGIKTTLKITCRPMTSAQIATILQLIEPEWVKVKFTDPTTNSVVTKTMYSNNVPLTLRNTDGLKDQWTGLNFPLIEQ